MKNAVQNLVNQGKMLPLMEAFYTIQGEGFHKGTAAYFVRIGGCDVGCHWCDVKESWNAKLHPPTAIDVIVDEAAKYSNTIVVTGGEPLSWDMTEFTKLLKAKGMQIHIETSGAYDLTGVWDWICLSPKKTKLPKSGIYKVADELKMIIYNKDDFRFAEDQETKMTSFKFTIQKDVIFFLQFCNPAIIKSSNLLILRSLRP